MDESGTAIGPLYKGGLTPEVISAYPELDWMIEADQDLANEGSEEKLIWVLADDWDYWRESHDATRSGAGSQRARKPTHVIGPGLVQPRFSSSREMPSVESRSS